MPGCGGQEQGQGQGQEQGQGLGQEQGQEQEQENQENQEQVQEQEEEEKEQEQEPGQDPEQNQPKYQDEDQGQTEDLSQSEEDVTLDVWSSEWVEPCSTVGVSPHTSDCSQFWLCRPAGAMGLQLQVSNSLVKGWLPTRFIQKFPGPWYNQLGLGLQLQSKGSHYLKKI